MTIQAQESTANAAPAAWIPDDSTFGARLALVRQRMAWGNVKEAAVACGLPTESWRTWERDGVEPRGLLRVATLIAGRTGCDLGWLVGGAALRDRPTTIRYDNLTVRAVGGAPRDNRPKNHKPNGHPEVRRTKRVARPPHKA